MSHSRFESAVPELVPTGFSGFTAREGQDDRSDPCVYIDATYTDENGKKYRGPLLCLSPWVFSGEGESCWTSQEDRKKIADMVVQALQQWKDV